jgi:uncharacterized protein YecA (UPF0149 family)
MNDPTVKDYELMEAIERKVISRIGRNETCACGSGIKFKKCCISKKGKGARVERIYRVKQ